jgi:hypothetical protein
LSVSRTAKARAKFTSKGYKRGAKVEYENIFLDEEFYQSRKGLYNNLIRRDADLIISFETH